MQWERMYALLCVYREREGHANVPDRPPRQRSRQDGERLLGGWL